MTASESASLVWRHAAPDSLASVLRAIGREPRSAEPDGYAVSLGGLGLRIVPADGRERLEFADGRDPLPAVLRRARRVGVGRRARTATAAIALGTVDVGRIAPRVLGEAPVDVEDPALGGRGLAARAGSPRVIVLEPATEGRLAAALARHGEGPVALYLAGQRPVADAFPVALDAPRPWPLGERARLWRPEHRWGPFLFVVDDFPES